MALAEKQAEIAKDNLGRKFRKDGLIMIQVVASYPTRTNEVAWEDPNLQHWLKLTIQFLSSKYGKQLKSVVVHSDEPFRHCHFSLVPSVGNDNRLDIGKVHPSIAARSTVKTKSAHTLKL
ncbi:plasmid recombination protein [Vibrio spartinae]|uniref:plasmid recombination protein n=1 Tax=Vibrio spartinae TaxID=1918945 RepID=UPI00094347C3|nr:plasmid recombination protein [Vibrio spartinae]